MRAVSARGLARETNAVHARMVKTRSKRGKRVEADEYFRRTMPEWRRLGAYALRRWPAPAGVEVEDVAQELALRAWVALRDYDPERAVRGGAARYVQWNALARTRKELDRQARRKDGAGIPVPLSWLEHAPDPACEGEQGDVEERQAFGARVAQIAAAIGRARARAVAAISATGGDLDEAARAVCREAGLCSALRVRSEADARGAIRRALAAALDVDN